MSHSTATIQYFTHIKSVNTEEAKKQLFYNLLNEWFREDPTAKQIISQMAMGAEKSVFNIPKNTKNQDGTRLKTGRADTQYRQVIIEFENDIQAKAKREHAEYQLKEYFAGNFNSGNAFDFYLIATDCIRWAVYGVKPESYLGKKNVTPENIELKIVESFILSDTTADNFFHFIDRYLFRFDKQPATLNNILIDFGDSSALFINVFGEMVKFYKEHQDQPQLRTAYTEWKRFMSVAYGSFEDSIEVFVVHSYLSVFAKLIAYEVITKDNYIDYEEMYQVLTGEMFEKYNIKNFVEKDFYQWVVIPEFFNKLHRHFSKIAEKISDYDFTNVQSDILKGVYQKLIDLETRHALGEYYTPDWLCETVARHFHFEATARILDPSCGSGSFLLAAVNRLKVLHPNVDAETLARQVSGIDIHPLSVQIAKTTLLLAIGTELLQNTRRPFNLRVYLSNSLLTPQSHHSGQNSVTLFGDEFGVSINNKKYDLPTGTFDDPAFFDVAVEVADYMADQTKDKPNLTKEILADVITKRYPNGKPAIIDRFYAIYIALKTAKESGEDSIWKFILQNTYKPFFLKNTFDYIIGNPPWFTYSSIKNTEYQNILKTLADRYEVTPTKKANMPHLEIAAIFMSHCSHYLLKKSGKQAFVVPRSFLSAEHHDNTRTGKAIGFKLTEVWDLQEVHNLFNIPSCVLFSERCKAMSPIPKEGLLGKSFAGRPRQHNATFEDVQDRMTVVENRWYYSQLKKSSALTTNSQSTTITGDNFYKNHFKQGATIVPRNFYFIEIDGKQPTDFHDRIVSVKSAAANEKDAKEPWKSLKMRGRINTQFLFRTAIAKNIVPFGIIAPPLVLLPIELKKVANSKIGEADQTKIKLLSPQDILAKAELETATYFNEIERLWNENKTENNAKMTSWDYLNWQNKLTDQNLNKRYCVLYSASAKDANAGIAEQGSFDLPFIVESKAYVFYTNNLDEAYFLIAFLNSNSANLSIKDFQTTGLFGPRDVHKKILDIPLPQYNADNALHQRISKLGKECAATVADYIKTENLETTDYNVGKERSNIRKLLVKELSQIDKALAGLIDTANS